MLLKVFLRAIGTPQRCNLGQSTVHCCRRGCGSNPAACGQDLNLVTPGEPCTVGCWVSAVAHAAEAAHAPQFLLGQSSWWPAARSLAHPAAQSSPQTSEQQMITLFASYSYCRDCFNQDPVAVLCLVSATDMNDIEQHWKHMTFLCAGTL